MTEESLERDLVRKPRGESLGSPIFHRFTVSIEDAAREAFPCSAYQPAARRGSICCINLCGKNMDTNFGRESTEV